MGTRTILNKSDYRVSTRDTQDIPGVLDNLREYVGTPYIDWGGQSI